MGNSVPGWSERHSWFACGQRRAKGRAWAPRQGARGARVCACVPECRAPAASGRATGLALLGAPLWGGRRLARLGGRRLARDRVGAAQPARKVNIGAAARAERAIVGLTWPPADRARLR